MMVGQLFAFIFRDIFDNFEDQKEYSKNFLFLAATESISSNIYFNLIKNTKEELILNEYFQ